jgi:hypothetical protein
MSTSTIIFLSAVGCGLLFAACAWLAEMGPEQAPVGHGGKGRKGKKAQEPPAPAPRRRPRWVLPLVVLAACTGFGGLAFLIDDGVAQETLYEIEADGTGASVPETFRFQIPVEHPGVEHELLVAPLSPASVSGPVDLRVQVVDGAGRVLLDRAESLDTRGCDPFCEWDDFSGTYTPAAAGNLTLAVTVSTPDVPTLHVRVGDPEKTDGQRAPGY